MQLAEMHRVFIHFYLEQQVFKNVTFVIKILKNNFSHRPQETLGNVTLGPYVVQTCFKAKR
jgi:hypothetical protein